MIDGHDLELFERSLEHATGNHTGATLDAALDDLGWRDAFVDDPRVAVSRLFALQGAANVTSSALNQVLGGDGWVVLPALGEWRAAGTSLDGSLHIEGLLIGAPRDTALVVVSGVGFTVEVGVLRPQPIAGVDPSLGLVAVQGEVADATEVGPVDWPAAVAVGQLALGHELVGASRRMLDLARDHAVDRIQFGQPIAMFQAVRHRLAETLVAIEAAEAALDAAWLDREPVSAATAKAVAGRAARTTARHCQQVLAGIGFTTEHPFHRHVKRTLVLDQLLGSTHALTLDLGARILATQQLPPLVPL
jgi:hypothetical protein